MFYDSTARTAKLAREIHCTRNNLYKIFNKPSLDGDLILKISVAMNFNNTTRRNLSKA